MSDKSREKKYLQALEKEKREDEWWQHLDERVGPYVRTLNLALAITIFYFVLAIGFEPVGLYTENYGWLQGISATLFAAAVAEMLGFSSMNKGELATELKIAGLERRHRRAFFWSLVVSVSAVVLTFATPAFLGSRALIIVVFLVAYQVTLVVFCALNLLGVSEIRTLLSKNEQTQENQKTNGQVQSI